MKNNTKPGENLPLAIFFGVFVVGIIIASLIWKGITLLRQSNFDQTHQLVLLVKSNDFARVIVFNPDTQTINILNVSGSVNPNEIGKTIEVPIDATVTTSFQMPVASFVSHLILPKKDTGKIFLTDRLKLWWFARSVPDTSIFQYQIQLPATQDVLDTKIPKIFNDRTLYLEAKTITVVNATGQNGFATRFSKLLSNIGANVIMVSSTDNPLKKSNIEYIGDNSYTLTKLQKILHIIPVRSEKKNAISDITVILGEDEVNTNQF